MPIIMRGAKYLFATVCVYRVKTVDVDGEIKRAHVMRARLSICSSDLSDGFHKLYFTISFYKDVSKIPVDHYMGTTSRPPVFILFFFIYSFSVHAFPAEFPMRLQYYALCVRRDVGNLICAYNNNI